MIVEELQSNTSIWKDCKNYEDVMKIHIDQLNNVSSQEYQFFTEMSEEFQNNIKRLASKNIFVYQACESLDKNYREYYSFMLPKSQKSLIYVLELLDIMIWKTTVNKLVIMEYNNVDLVQFVPISKVDPLCAVRYGLEYPYIFGCIDEEVKEKIASEYICCFATDTVWGRKGYLSNIILNTLENDTLTISEDMNVCNISCDGEKHRKKHNIICIFLKDVLL